MESEISQRFGFFSCNNINEKFLQWFKIPLIVDTFSSLVRLTSFAHRKTWASRSFNILIVCFFLFTLCFAISRGYIYLYPNFGNDYRIFESLNSTRGCDIFNGVWVRDDSYPRYKSSQCPFAERGFNCQANGRRDKDYMKWRWKPHNCDSLRFDVREALERFRGLRIVFVGDSMGRTQWESLICLLMTGIEDKRSVYEINGNKITKQIRFLGTRFSSYNFTVEYFRSPFLVQHSGPPRRSPKRIRSTLKLDKLDDISRKWIDSDILIFNSGHWWTEIKTFQSGCYFQVRNSVKLGMKITTAYRTAISTWASWVETMVNTSRTRVFFRTYETSHWSDFSAKRTCRVTRYPMSETKGHEKSPFSDIISEVVVKMKVPVTLLHITFLSAFRSDAHNGKWSDTPTVPDCSHWCLPGVPDTWNELLLSYLISMR